jgi:hypothetical protein
VEVPVGGKAARTDYAAVRSARAAFGWVRLGTYPLSALALPLAPTNRRATSLGAGSVVPGLMGSSCAAGLGRQ